MKIRARDLCVAKVLYEDKDSIGLEIIKDANRQMEIDPDGDRFYTMLFVRKANDSSMEIWKPWS